uniref:Uncharacterized protein n=1 Tax=Triticum urartu TaxID=4572 RepID=A0A8R7K230_TRIUA
MDRDEDGKEGRRGRDGADPAAGGRFRPDPGEAALVVGHGCSYIMYEHERNQRKIPNNCAHEYMASEEVAENKRGQGCHGDSRGGSRRARGRRGSWSIGSRDRADHDGGGCRHSKDP